MCKCAHLCLSGGNIVINSPVFQSLYHLLHFTQYSSVFCDESINFLLIAFCGRDFWSPAARQIRSVPVVIFEVFKSLSHIGSTHAGISIYMAKDQSLHAGKLMHHHLQPFCHSGLWVSIYVHVLDHYLRLQKRDTAFYHMVVRPTHIWTIQENDWTMLCCQSAHWAHPALYSQCVVMSSYWKNARLKLTPIPWRSAGNSSWRIWR